MFQPEDLRDEFYRPRADEADELSEVLASVHRPYEKPEHLRPDDLSDM